jgi:uncharacterized membrane protein
MKRMLLWIWQRGVISTFLTGFFTVLPFVITIAIMAWVGSTLQQWVGPESPAGMVLRAIGLRFVTDEVVASFIGWALVVTGLWFVGAVVKSTAKYKLEEAVATVLKRIPIIKSIYKPVSQVVDLLRRDDPSDLQRMRVVYCGLGQEYGGGFLGLRASENIYRFGARQCYVVYVPTAPVPMSGAVIFVPVDDVEPIEMEVEDLIQICVSLGMMASNVVPAQYMAGLGSDGLKPTLGPRVR